MALFEPVEIHKVGRPHDTWHGTWQRTSESLSLISRVILMQPGEKEITKEITKEKTKKFEMSKERTRNKTVIAER